MQLRHDLLLKGVSFAVDEDSKEALFQTLAHQCSERLTLEDMQHTWADYPEGEWLGTFFLWCMHVDLQGEDLEWWRHAISGWVDGLRLLHVHDLAVHVHTDFVSYRMLLLRGQPIWVPRPPWIQCIQGTYLRYRMCGVMGCPLLCTVCRSVF